MAILSKLKTLGSALKSNVLITKIGANYKKIDQALGGYLPAGITPTAAKTTKLKQKNTETIALNKQITAREEEKARQDLATEKLKTDTMIKKGEYKAQQDLANTGFWETLFGKVSQEEQVYNALKQKGAYYPLVTETSQAMIPDYNAYVGLGTTPQQLLNTELPSIPQQESGFSSTIKSLTLPLLIIASIIIVPRLLNKK